MPQIRHKKYRLIKTVAVSSYNFLAFAAQNTNETFKAH